MKFFVITDSTDTKVGLRLSGIEGVVVRTEAEVNQALDDALRDNEIGILLLTERLAEMCRERLKPLKLSGTGPLVLEIPDRHSMGRAPDSITRYIRESVGIKI